jgi:hypothetical protein
VVAVAQVLQPTVVLAVLVGFTVPVVVAVVRLLIVLATPVAAVRVLKVS